VTAILVTDFMNKLDSAAKEIEQAEELLLQDHRPRLPRSLSGRFVADWVMPYPRIPAAQQTNWTIIGSFSFSTNISIL
jgi:hypothetical protein